MYTNDNHHLGASSLFNDSCRMIQWWALTIQTIIISSSPITITSNELNSCLKHLLIAASNNN